MAQVINENISWSKLRTIINVGQIVRGQVIKHAPYGIFVDLGIPFDGLVQITDFKDQGIMSPQEYPPIGQEIDAVVLGFKEFGHQIWLGMRPSQFSAVE